MSLCHVFRWLCHRNHNKPHSAEIVFHFPYHATGATKMDLTLPIDEPNPIPATFVYKDRKGNVTQAPAGVTINWTDSNPATASIDNTTGATVNVAVVSSNVGDTTVLSATDGTFSPTATITLGPGKPASAEIDFGPLA